MFIQYDYFKNIVDECVPNSTHIRMSGYGEPLLHPKFFDLLEYGKLKGAKLSLITNGSLLNETKIKRLLDIEIDSIEISVDSHKRDIYERIRVGLSYDKVEKNIVNLMEYKKEHEKKTIIMASIINQPSINPEINEAVQYWNNIVDKVMLRTYVTWGILPTADCKEVPDKRTACPYPFERLMIDPAGYIRLCPYDDQKIIEPLGHISNDTIKKVWTSERVKKIRLGHETNDWNNIELCNKCTDWAYRSWNHNYRNIMKEYDKNNKT
jgi:MoaA/NifB/PqqE/SkfB family radical SAM enzyme